MLINLRLKRLHRALVKLLIPLKTSKSAREGLTEGLDMHVSHSILIWINRPRREGERDLNSPEDQGKGVVGKEEKRGFEYNMTAKGMHMEKEGWCGNH